LERTSFLAGESLDHLEPVCPDVTPLFDRLGDPR
jgi:hypothetical protein